MSECVRCQRGMRKGLECRQRTQEEGAKLKAGRHEEAGPGRAGAGRELEWGPGIAEGDPWGLAGFPHPWEPHTSPGLGLGREEEDTAPPPLPVSLFSVSLPALSSFPKTECKGHSPGTTSQKTRRTRDEVSGETPDKGVTFSASDSRASGRKVGRGPRSPPFVGPTQLWALPAGEGY